MVDAAQSIYSIIPAQLSYLTIYNPTLGPTDETFQQQLVFYYSRTEAESKLAARRGVAQHSKEDTDERLRRIGIAQGLVEFARTFSDGAPVESAETEKSRIVLHELEKDWWVLASIDLTRIPTNIPASSTASSAKPDKREQTSAPKTSLQAEYSSREVSPPILLARQITDAHAVFSLHHGPSLSNLYARLPRDRFCSLLDRFWGRFAKTWDVLLHGNPAVDALSGIKLASGGELGFGVGEEEWGSSERAVLEDISRQSEGLVDAVVARFGDEAVSDDLPADLLPWIGGADIPSVHDGVIFGGINGITRRSLQSLSLWMRHIYTYGDNAYGVKDNPTRDRRRRRRRNVSEQMERQSAAGTDKTTLRVEDQDRTSSAEHSKTREVQRPLMPPVSKSRDFAPGHSTPDPVPEFNIPPPIVSAAEAALTEATRKADAKQAERGAINTEEASSTLGIPDQYLKYLTLGLSTYAKSSPRPQPPKISRTATAASSVSQRARKAIADASDIESDTPALAMLDPMPDGNVQHARVARQKRHENQGHFLIGLKGDIDNVPDDLEAELTEGSIHAGDEGHRIVVRTVHVEMLNREGSRTAEDSDATVRPGARTIPARLRAVIYARRPFIYTFLFEQRTSSLSYASFYRSLHHNLSPIHQHLLRSTQPSNVADRIHATQPAELRTDSTPVYEVMFDPVRLTVHATVPNIPEPGSLAAEGILMSGHYKASSWSRLEALNVHSAMLNLLGDTRRHHREVERTSKTTRGWWVVWVKLQPSDQTGNETLTGRSNGDEHETNKKDCQIAFVVRKTTGSQPSHDPTRGSASRAASGMWNTLASTLRAGEAETPLERITSHGVGAGIGFDARRYIEGLLSLNR